MNKKWFSLSLALFALTFGVSAPASALPVVESRVVTLNCGIYLHTYAKTTIRSKASSKGKVVGTIPRGKCVKWTADACGGWFKVNYNGKVGWVSSRSASPDDGYGSIC